MLHLIDDFNAERVDCGERTRQWYAARIKNYLKYLESTETALQASSAIDVKRFFALLKNNKASWSTRNGTYTALYQFHLWLELRGHIAKNPFDVEPIKRPKKPKRIKPDLHLSSVQTVLDVLAQHDTRESKRDAALILLMVDGGVRRMEAVGLNVANVNLATGKISILVAKNDDQRWTLIRPITKTAIRRWLDAHPAPRPNQPLFTALKGRTSKNRLSERRVNGILSKWSDSAGLMQPLRPHDLRRLFVTTFADNGGGLSVIQSLAGHANIKTTESYIHTQEGEIIRQHAKNSPGQFLKFAAADEDGNNEKTT